jgi:DNA-binding response OmpR family regulator
MKQILLLEDDQLLSETLQLFLEREGYSVDIALTLKEAEKLTFNNAYDLYLFDINLPQGSGLELLEYLRLAEDKTDTIFITALTDLNSMAKGFELGAIDYIKKPFHPQELLIRLKYKFRSSVIFIDEVEFDQEAELIRKGGEVVDIGLTQYHIFQKLILNRGSVVNKVDLLELLEYPSDNALRVAITKIKQRLGIEVRNIRAKGYMIE